MGIRIVRLGSPRAPDEGVRIGTVRRPPRGVPKARFASVGSVSVSYWMVDPATSNVVVSGVAIGAAQLGGKVGETPVITPLTIPEM